MHRTTRVLGLVAALGLLLGAFLFGGQPRAYASDPVPTPTSAGTGTNGVGSGGHGGG